MACDVSSPRSLSDRSTKFQKGGLCHDNWESLQLRTLFAIENLWWTWSATSISCLIMPHLGQYKGNCMQLFELLIPSGLILHIKWFGITFDLVRSHVPFTLDMILHSLTLTDHLCSLSLSLVWPLQCRQPSDQWCRRRACLLWPFLDTMPSNAINVVYIVYIIYIVILHIFVTATSLNRYFQVHVRKTKKYQPCHMSRLPPAAEFLNSILNWNKNMNKIDRIDGIDGMQTNLAF